MESDGIEMTNCQFDSSVGGTEQLPDYIRILPFVTSRSVEIACMTESIFRPSATKLIFQTLPVHMRRRVMSQNSKRLPRKLRSGHWEQLKKSGIPPKLKRSSRKYRRRPKNLLNEYNRRQRQYKWLETHIWHAKRFHITKRWGYCLPEAPCDKAFRACYRATSSHCLLQDLSYTICLELSGKCDLLAKGFNQLTSPWAGLSVCSKAFMSGSRQGSFHMYGPCKYPFKYIGNVDFIWKPYFDHSDLRTIWIFLHPAFYEEALCAFIETFNLSKKEFSNVNKSVGGGGKKKFEASENPCYENKISMIQLLDFKNNFNRFRLTGPKSHAILVNCLKAADDVHNLINDPWMSSWNGKSSKSLFIQEQYEYWKSLNYITSASEIPRNTILSLVVTDPRLVKPSKRTKAEIDKSCRTPSDSLLHTPNNISFSVLWDTSVRNVVAQNTPSTAYILKYIEENQLIPGETIRDIPNVQNVPVILIQKPGSHHSRIGYNSGWDLLLPPGYGMPFWISLILWGARVGGLRESENIAFENAQPYLDPDTKAGQLESQRESKVLMDKYFRLPPKKRVNFVKFGINSPFLCRWDILSKDWSPNNEQDDYFVLRNKQQLEDIKMKIRNCGHLPSIEEKGCLIPVRIKLLHKGRIKKFALICMPHQSDLNSKINPVEPKRADKNGKLRVKLMKEHHALLKQLRRKRLKLRKMTKIAKSESLIYGSSKICDEFKAQMRELWLPTDITIIRNQCSREVMGYITQGGFSFTEATSTGVGYIAYDSLVQLVQNLNFIRKTIIVLVRNNTSRQYRKAALEIIL